MPCSLGASATLLGGSFLLRGRLPRNWLPRFRGTLGLNRHHLSIVRINRLYFRLDGVLLLPLGGRLEATVLLLALGGRLEATILLLALGGRLEATILLLALGGRLEATILWLARPPPIVEPAPVPSPPPRRWIPGVAPSGQLPHRPQERLFPMPRSRAYMAPILITKATAAAMRPFTMIERRAGRGRCENQPTAALMRPMKLSRRSGRPGSVSVGGSA
jgi:hypothetical protein